MIMANQSRAEWALNHKGTKITQHAGRDEEDKIMLISWKMPVSARALFLLFVSSWLSISAGGARADRLIWIPTATTSRLQAEYMTEIAGNRGVLTGQIGLGKQFEVLVRHYRKFGGDDSTEVGGQFQVLPEGIATPAIALGVWDVANDGPRGRRVFGVISKSVPVINKLPVGIHDIRVHLGVGSNQLSGPFVGGQVGFPFGFRTYAEYDTRHFNAGISWSPLSPLRLKVESWGGDVFAGAQLISPF